MPTELDILGMTRRAFVDVEDLHVHYAEVGQGEPVLFLHQTPRSWDEYRDVLPLVGQRYRAIAMDTAGFGDSSKPSWPGSMQSYARIAAGFLQALGIDHAHVVGHHTGGVIAVELAAAYPERVLKLVLSSTPLVDETYHRMRAERPSPDDVQYSDDGAHLLELWRGRQGFYPKGRHDLLDRFVMDALKAGEGAHNGHLAVSSYDMEPRLPLVKAPALIIGATDDPFCYPMMRPLANRLPGSQTVEIPGGMVPLPDQLPREFAKALLDFLGAPVG